MGLGDLTLSRDGTQQTGLFARAALLGPGAAALLGILAVAAIVILNDDSRTQGADFAISVSGVPDYIVLDNPVTVTIEYENRGAAESGPLILSVVVPSNFELRESDPAATVVAGRWEWQIDSLRSGASGSVRLTLEGEPPADATGARYDYEGIEGYTAFDDGCSS